VQIIECVFVFAQKLFKETGVSIMCVSGAISVLCLPLYMVAENWQEVERKIQKRLAPKIAKIKAVFKGDEQYMILSTYYRQNHYHPVYAMRSTFGLLIQIPFFIAAYSYLAHLDALQGSRFLFIRDLGKPDALLLIGGGGVVSLNILPILMTLINCTSGAVYTRGLAIKDKVQLYGMSLVFLVLLYNSPAGLVLYWTLNNVFSLIKNILQKIHPVKQVVYVFCYFFIVLLDVYILFFHPGHPSKRFIAAGICSLLLFFPLFIKFYHRIPKRSISDTFPFNTKMFLCATFALFLITGLVIPSALIASSVTEFSFIETYTSPFPFIGTTMIQAAGFFLFWGIILYYFFSNQVKLWFTLFFSLFSLIALINTFGFPGNYGFLTTTLIFSNTEMLNVVGKNVFINILILIAVTIVYIFLFFFNSKWKRFLYSFQIVIVLTLVTLGVINIVKIHYAFSELLDQKNTVVATDDKKKIYHFSKQGKNVLVIMLDRAISGYVPYIFQEKPELLTSFRGFTWYPNCVSLGGYTLLGVPALFGGYEYGPDEVQKRANELLVKKYNESLLVLPRLFLENGFVVTVTDPSWANFRLDPDLRIYNDYPSIHAENLHGRYTMNICRKYPDLQVISISALLEKKLLRFSLFKISPSFLRQILYDYGNWLVTTKFGSTEMTSDTLDNYANLDILPEITGVINTEENRYTALVNDLTHEPAFFQAPDYVPANKVTNKGNSLFAEEDSYHVNMAALILLGKWFYFLQQHDVYDNTRIIIVSDHGWYINSALPDNFTLPNGSSFLNFNPLLMVKDFKNSEQSDNGFITDNTFMTHADVPFLASKDITNAENPFTHKPLHHDKTGGVIISTAYAWESPDPLKYTWKIQTNEWLYVKENIFKPENWSAVSK
jgi:YidC/Oxa1 family membrane protein insertase